MKLQIVEFYEDENDKKNKKLTGSMHVYLVDYDIDIRGVDVSLDDGKPWITLPSIIRYDKITKQDVRFPVLQFGNRQKTLKLRAALIKAALEYIHKNVLNKKPNVKKKFNKKKKPVKTFDEKQKEVGEILKKKVFYDLKTLKTKRI